MLQTKQRWRLFQSNIGSFLQEFNAKSTVQVMSCLLMETETVPSRVHLVVFLTKHSPEHKKSNPTVDININRKDKQLIQQTNIIQNQNKQNPPEIYQAQFGCQENQTKFDILNSFNIIFYCILVSSTKLNNIPHPQPPKKRRKLYHIFQ